jgi:peroxiredoxin
MQDGGLNMRLKPGDKAIPFSVETIEGKPISLELFTGKPLLLMFYGPDGRILRTHYGREIGDHLAVKDVETILVDIGFPAS